MFLANNVQIILFLLIFTGFLGPSYAKFVCENGRVVDRSKRCDGEKDCKDESDERQCSACVGNAFHCNQTQECFPHNFKCNGQEDCPGGSDEQNCPCPDPDNQFQCENGDCIDKAGRCNSIPNCFDGSDERNCSACFSYQGFPQPFHCKPTLQCLSHDLICNNQPDCPDGSDEDKVDCPTNWFWWFVSAYGFQNLSTLCILYELFKTSSLLHVVKTLFLGGIICQCYSWLNTRLRGTNNHRDRDPPVSSEDTSLEENNENANFSDNESKPLVSRSRTGENSDTNKKETFSAGDVLGPSNFTKQQDTENDSDSTTDEDKGELRQRRTFKPLRSQTTRNRKYDIFGPTYDDDSDVDNDNYKDRIVRFERIKRVGIGIARKFLATIKSKFPSKFPTKTAGLVTDDIVNVTVTPDAAQIVEHMKTHYEDMSTTDLRYSELAEVPLGLSAEQGIREDVRKFRMYLRETRGYVREHASSITFYQFVDAVKINGYDRPSDDQFIHFMTGLDSAGITTKTEAAMFLAHVLHESDGLKQKQGDGGPYKYNPEGIPATEVAGKYSGRGYIPLTYESNYKAASEWLGFWDLLICIPELVALEEILAWGVSFYSWVINVRPKLGEKTLLFGQTTTAMYGKLDEDKFKERFWTYKRIFKCFRCPGEPMM